MRERLGLVMGWVSIIVNTVLFGIKLYAGWKAGSVAMVADAWHTLSDSFTSVVVVVGFLISARPADRRHPFGHGRAESVAAIVIGTLLGVVGFRFLATSIEHLGARQAARFGVGSIAVFAASAVVKETLAQCSFWVSRRLGSTALRADGWHHRSDAVASAVIVAGAFLAPSWWIDAVLGVVVSGLVIHAAFDIVFTNSHHLLGEKLDPATEERIRSLIAQAGPEASDVHHFHVHRYGDHVELSFHLRLTPQMRVGDAHGVADEIERRLKREMNIDATVHVEPTRLPCYEPPRSLPSHGEKVEVQTGNVGAPLVHGGDDGRLS